MMKSKFYRKISSIPAGSNEVIYNDNKYLLTKESLQKGKIIKVYAKQLNGNDFISFNIYKTVKGNNLKPCEMPQQKVVDFILNYEPVQ